MIRCLHSHIKQLNAVTNDNNKFQHSITMLHRNKAPFPYQKDGILPIANLLPIF